MAHEESVKSQLLREKWEAKREAQRANANNKMEAKRVKSTDEAMGGIRRIDKEGRSAQSVIDETGTKAYQRSAQRDAELRRVRKIKTQAGKVLSSIKKASGQAKVATKKAKRAYKKTTAWYNTRVDQGGEHRNPQEFEGMDSDNTGDPNVRRVGGSRFHAGGVAGYQRDPMAVGSHERLEMGFRSPLDNDNSQGQFGGASKLLGVSNNQSDLLNLSNKSGEKKKEIKWF